MRIVVTGVSGQLGFDVCRELDRRHIENVGLASRDMNIADMAEVERVITHYMPDCVIHCAAYTAVDKAEDDSEKCFAINRDGTENIALICKRIGASMLYVSTDYVFPGDGDAFYEPNDEKGPLNVYGRSKLEGERAMQAVLERSYVVRTSWVFGINGKNFVRTMLGLAEKKDSVGVVCDQMGSPTYTADLAPLLCDIAQSDKFGIYHATNEGICSFADLAEETFKLSDKAVTVERLKTKDYITKAVRPLNSRLSKQCLEDAGFSRLPDWHNALERYLGELKFEDQTHSHDHN